MLHHKLYEYHQAVKRSDWRYINEYIKNGGNINAQLKKTGSKAGYTALHLAATNKNPTCARKLILNYGANVNSVGADGAHPIHLAYLTQNFKVFEILLTSGASPDTELTKALHDKYAKDKKWSDGFGDKMTLLTHTIINDDWKFGRFLLDNKANVWIKDTNNKTLLMYAVNSSVFTMSLLRIYKDNLELINARDNNGLHVFHHLLHDDQFEGFRYDAPVGNDTSRAAVGMDLYYAEADINAMVDSNPDTLLLNMAAFRACYCLLESLMRFDVFPKIVGKPLRYFLIPFDADKYIRPCDEHDHTGSLAMVNRRRYYCAKHILENYTLRREFGMFVPKEEILLMDQLVAEDNEAKEIVRSFENNFINGSLRNQVLRFSDKCMTFYEIMEKVFDDRALKLLVKDDKFVEGYAVTFYNGEDREDYLMVVLIEFVRGKVKRASERRKLMRKVEKIPGLLEAIPLPYEIILEIIEFIDNKNLKNFVDAFYQDPNDSLY